ncbi:hypothetical protein E1A91_D09G073200v1 [Gossypium mustelinum]|uniref:CRIB domain-containing protein n=5 Tax=Gossypium TaxID=3633 RepID=A0A7J8YVI4_GOSAI|nr:hypothetical protein [Gossypium aridum]TYI64228.1 hypothetical protein E1A91_D09G073200v1 [Gossypium mustelinum]
MNGLLKSLKYFTHMFVDKKPEMQIGPPTDVKHVAHIGMDGPSATKPSWMNEFTSAPKFSADALNGNLEVNPSASGNPNSLPPNGNEKQRKKHRKPAVETDSPKGSPKASKKSKQNRLANNSTAECPGQEVQRTKNSIRDSESSCQDATEVPKKPRKKKSRGSSGGSGTSSPTSTSKAPNLLPSVNEVEC